MIDTARDTIELRSAVAVNDTVTKTVRQMVDDFESCVGYLSESPQDGLSLPEPGDRPASGWSTRRPQVKETGRPANPELLKIIFSELSAFLRIPVDTVREESSLLSLGLDSLKAIALSQRLRERGVSLSPVDIIRTGSVGRLALAPAMENQQGSFSKEGSVTELDQLLQRDIPMEMVRLDKEDQVEITAATALQAGMLSQVI